MCNGVNGSTSYTHEITLPFSLHAGADLAKAKVCDICSAAFERMRDYKDVAADVQTSKCHKTSLIASGRLFEAVDLWDCFTSGDPYIIDATTRRKRRKTQTTFTANPMEALLAEVIAISAKDKQHSRKRKTPINHSAGKAAKKLVVSDESETSTEEEEDVNYHFDNSRSRTLVVINGIAQSLDVIDATVLQ